MTHRFPHLCAILQFFFFQNMSYVFAFLGRADFKNCILQEEPFRVAYKNATPPDYLGTIYPVIGLHTVTCLINGYCMALLRTYLWNWVSCVRAYQIQSQTSPRGMSPSCLELLPWQLDFSPLSAAHTTAAAAMN